MSVMKIATKQGFRVSETSNNATDLNPSNNKEYTHANTPAYCAGDTLSQTADIDNIWLLPDGVSDLFSDEAQKQEWLRYNLTQLLVKRGYQLICPPMIEYTESLLGNASEDLKRRTFKIIDQLSGRLMGVRADITPQILRIDAHLTKLGKEMPVSRYCYAGHVIRTLPDGLFGSRTPLQLGAEIFGCSSLDADIELMDVLFYLLDYLDIKQHLHIDVGHVAIFNRLKELAGLSSNDTTLLIDLYANKALPELNRVCSMLPMGEDFYQLAVSGCDIDRLKQQLSEAALSDSIIIDAVNDVKALATHLTEVHHANVSIDVTELGFHYHTGIVFNAYFENESQAVVRGGRFNSAQPVDAFNESNSAGQSTAVSDTQHNREATGFSLDVSRLQRYITLEPQKLVLVDYADLQSIKSQPKDEQSTQCLNAKIQELRDMDYQVVRPLNAEDIPSDTTHKLVLQSGDWVLASV